MLCFIGFDVSKNEVTEFRISKVSHFQSFKYQDSQNIKFEKLQFQNMVHTFSKKLHATASAADPFNLDAAGRLAGWLAVWLDFMDFGGFSWIWCHNALGLGTTLRLNLLPL